MRNLKTLLALVLALALCLGNVALAEEETTVYQLGDAIQDFTVTTYDGETVTLSEVLKEKEAVLINIWATWCGPCQMEFPYMEEAYEQYKDKVEVIALSCEPTDNAEVLAAFVDERGLTFKVGQETAGLTKAFQVNGIPTSVVVDRFGTICFVESGSMPDTESFTRLFDMFVGDDYAESKILEGGMPKVAPNVEACSTEELSAALNVEGAALTFENCADEMIWPMLVAEKDGRQVVAASNTGVNDSEAGVTTTVTAAAGDAVVVDFKLSSEVFYDLMRIRINGKTVKSFCGEKDWMTYAWPVAEDGTYEVTVAYVKDGVEFAGDDCLWVDSISVVSGDEAVKALADNPVYLTAEETYIKVLNENAKEIVIDDPTGTLDAYFGDSKYYLVPDEQISVEIGLSADVEQETTCVSTAYDGASYMVAELEQDGKFLLSVGVDTMQTTGYDYSNIAIYCGEQTLANVVYLADEQNANAFMVDLADPETGDVVTSWKYADGTAPSTDEVAQLPEGFDMNMSFVSAYTVKYVDQNGDPVEGVMCQVCDDESCQVFVSDAEGVCSFELMPYPWEIHTLRLPEGYEGDTETVTVAPEEGGELTFTVTKN